MAFFCPTVDPVSYAGPKRANIANNNLSDHKHKLRPLGRWHNRSGSCKLCYFSTGTVFFALLLSNIKLLEFSEVCSSRWRMVRGKMILKSYTALLCLILPMFRLVHVKKLKSLLLTLKMSS